MKNITLGLLTLLIFSGCVPKMGKIHPINTPKSSTTAEVFIMRNYNYLGSGLRYYPH